MLTGTADTVMLTTYEVTRKSWWELLLVDCNGTAMPLGNYKIREVPTIKEASKPLAYTAFNSEVTYPGVRTQSMGDINLILFEQDQVYTFFRNWRKLVYSSNTDDVALRSAIVGSGSLIYYVPGPSSEDAIQAQKLSLTGVWPSAMTLLALSREDDGTPAGYSVSLEIGDIQDNS